MNSFENYFPDMRAMLKQIKEAWFDVIYNREGDKAKETALFPPN
jgi:hypothetical protein